MKYFSLVLLLGAWIALAGCGGDSGTAKAGSGGSTMSGGAAGSSSTGGIGGGNGGNGGKTDAGSTDTAGTKSDASAANADGTPRGDLAPVGDSCPAFTPCGGDLVGTWRLQSECLSTMPTSGNCVVGFSAIDLSAFQESFTFRANGTLTVSMTGTMAETLRYAAGCFLTDASATDSCSALQQQAQSSWPGQADAGLVPFNLAKFECSVDSTGVCVCDEKLDFNQHAESGTYSISGNQVTISDLSASPLPDGGLPDAGTNEPADYCVSGNTLMLKPGKSDSLMTLTK